jgi:hypothetical protein
MNRGGFVRIQLSLSRFVGVCIVFKAHSSQEKIEVLRRFKSPQDSGIHTIGGSPSPTRRADSSQFSETFSSASPAQHPTVTSFPATPLPDVGPISSSTPTPSPTTRVRGVLTKETTHEIITERFEHRPEKDESVIEMAKKEEEIKGELKRCCF